MMNIDEFGDHALLVFFASSALDMTLLRSVLQLAWPKDLNQILASGLRLQRRGQ